MGPGTGEHGCCFGTNPPPGGSGPAPAACGIAGTDPAEDTAQADTRDLVVPPARTAKCTVSSSPSPWTPLRLLLFAAFLLPLQSVACSLVPSQADALVSRRFSPGASPSAALGGGSLRCTHGGAPALHEHRHLPVAPWSLLASPVPSLGAVVWAEAFTSLCSCWSLQGGVGAQSSLQLVHTHQRPQRLEAGTAEPLAPH